MGRSGFRQGAEPDTFNIGCNLISSLHGNFTAAGLTTPRPICAPTVGQHLGASPATAMIAAAEQIQIA
jgi:hypothetical protein